MKSLKGKTNALRRDFRIFSHSGAQLARTFKKDQALLQGVYFARDLVNEPANILTPPEFVERLRALETDGLKVEVLDERALKSLGMNAMLSVGQGSAQPSAAVILRWNGLPNASASDGNLVFVGKGVCFDSGGISIKPSQGMEDMKGDMAGAAAVAGVMTALARRKAPVRAIGLVGLVENMPSGTASRPGDIVTSASGQTIEILNTDAEGRLVLADLLWYAQTHLEPKLIVTLATLTGAILVALGKEYAGLFSNDDTLASDISEAGQDVGELAWRLPLSKKYNKMIEFQARRCQEYRRARCGFDHRGAIPSSLRQVGHALGASRYRRHGDGFSVHRHQRELGVRLRRPLARAFFGKVPREPFGVEIRN